MTFCQSPLPFLHSTGKTDPTKKELRQKEKEAAERFEKMAEERDELDHIKKRRVWREHITNSDFDELRQKPTEREFNNSMNKWHKGVHYPYDMEKEGFPYVAVGILDGTEVVKDRNKYETMAPERVYSSHLYMDGNEGAEQAYREHMITINLNKVDKYLKQRKKEMVREEALAEELRQIREKQRRRAGKVERHDLADAIVTAKFNAIQSGNIKVKKIRNKIPGEEGNNENQEEEDDEWSFSDSSGGFGNKDEEYGAIGDTNAANAEKSSHKSKRPPPLDIGSSTSRSPTGSPTQGLDTASPSRRAVVNIPVFSFDANGNPIAAVSPNQQASSPINKPRKSTPRKVGFEGSEEKSDQESDDETDEKGGFSASSKKTTDSPSPTNENANAQEETKQYGNKSVKYSSKYVSWAQAGFDAMVIPDFMKESFSRKDSNVAPAPATAAAAPTSSAYKVKNFKQRNIVLRVIIHYVKKAHPKRLLVSVNLAVLQIKLQITLQF